MAQLPDQYILAQAADWFALLSSGDATTEDERRWELWLSESSEHRQSWQFVENISSRFERFRGEGSEYCEHTLNNLRRKRMNRRQAMTAMAVVMGTGVLTWASLRPGGLAAIGTRPDLVTAEGEIRQHQLPDGTQLWLNSDTAVVLDYTAAKRHLKLLQGEVLIETAADSRPFSIETLDGRMVPLGTKFSVRQLNDHTHLSVFEGRVRAEPYGTGSAVINAGQQVQFDKHQSSTVKTAEQHRRSWATGILVAEDIRLQDLLEELRPYQAGYIYLDAALREKRVFGAYPLSDSEKTLSMLQQVLPLEIKTPLPWLTFISQK